MCAKNGWCAFQPEEKMFLNVSFMEMMTQNNKCLKSTPSDVTVFTGNASFSACRIPSRHVAAAVRHCNTVTKEFLALRRLEFFLAAVRLTEIVLHVENNAFRVNFVMLCEKNVHTFFHLREAFILTSL